MAAFLELTPSDELIRNIIHECSLDRMRDRKGKYDLDEEGKSIMYRTGKNFMAINIFDHYNELAYVLMHLMV